MSTLTNHQYKLFNLANKISLFGSVIGAGISAISGQVVYAVVPLSFAVVLLNDANRRRFEWLQQIRQNYQIAVADVEQHPLEVENLKAVYTQLEPMPQKYLTKTHLTPIISKLHQLQHQLKIIELGEIQTLTQQVKEQQELLENLDASTEALHDRTRNWEQWQQQLAEVQQALKNEVFSRTIPPSLVAIPATAKSPHRSQQERVAIFVDDANLYHAASSLRIKIDYTHLLSLLKAKSSVCQVFLYTGVEPTNKKQKSFLSWLRRQGYRIVSKEVVRRADDSKKANLDVELSLDLVNLANSYDTAVLVSGDGDFTFPVKSVQSRGKRVEVVSFGSRTSDALIKVADSYLDLETILDQIC